MSQFVTDTKGLQVGDLIEVFVWYPPQRTVLCKVSWMQNDGFSVQSLNGEELNPLGDDWQFHRYWNEGRHWRKHVHNWGHNCAGVSFCECGANNL